MNILVACEESQVVTAEFRKRGHKAFSCDVLKCSGLYPKWHYQCDVTELLDETRWRWDMIIAFPPCTHLASSGAAWFKEKIKDGRQQQGIDFFMRFVHLTCPKVAIENPVGIMSRVWRKPDQIIQPYWFGDSASKKTCLWLKGLPKLVPTNMVDPGERVKFPNGKSLAKWYADVSRLPSIERSRIRSKTFPGIAKAMAEQWS